MLGFRQRCVLKAFEQFAEPVLQHEVLRRQFDILEADLVQVLAAHRVIGPGHRKARRALLDQDAADALAAGLFVDPREDDEHGGLGGAADQGFDAVEAQLVADPVDVGLVVRDIGAGVGLGHADRQEALAAAHRRQHAALDRLGRVVRDDAGLHPDLAEHRHRGHVAGLGDLLQHQRGVEHRQPEPAIFLRHRHAEHAQLGERLHVVPRERAVLQRGARSRNSLWASARTRRGRIGAARRSGSGTRGLTDFVGWVERSETHHGHAR